METWDLGGGAHVALWQQWLSEGEAQQLLDNLGSLPWQQREIQIRGQRIAEPRLTHWCGDPGARYRYSGRTNEPAPWPSSLLGVKERLQRELGRPFNSCLLNLYRNGQDSIGMHSDDESELGPEPVIASISLGASRKFHLRPRETGLKLDLWLPHGSLLCMRGTTQQRYRHGVPKCASSLPRVNLTFRLIG